MAVEFYRQGLSPNEHCPPVNSKGDSFFHDPHSAQSVRRKEAANAHMNYFLKIT